MANSNLYGKKLELYFGQSTGADIVSVRTAWNNKTKVSNLEIIIPMTTGNLNGNKFLFNPTLDNSVATQLDAFSQNWFMCTLLYNHPYTYTGNVNITDVLNIYTKEVSINTSTVGYYFLWDGTSDTVACIRISASGSLSSSRFYSISSNNYTGDQYIPCSTLSIAGNRTNGLFLFYKNGSLWSSSYGADNAVVYSQLYNEKIINASNFGDFFDGFEENYIPEGEDTDPYVGGGGSSGGGGGTGDFDSTSDTIGLPSLPSLSGLNTGFFTAFVPSASQMQSVSNYLWNNAITDILDPNTGLGEKVDALKKIVANPYDAIMGCSIIPVTPPTAGSKELKMYGLLETGISLPYASSRWVQVDCGTLNIHEFWGGYLDYSPYTKTTSLYLPYIGTVSIDIDLIMAKALQVVYYVDILSGICVAFILVDGSVKFHYQGQCATQIPITNADYSSVISSGIGLIGNASQVVGSAVTGGVGGGVGGAVAGAVAGAISQAPSIASNVMSAKPDIRSGGAIGSSAGILSVQRPYLIIERPKQSVPAFQNHFTGYPSNITAKVSDLTGYTEFETINLDGLFLTDSEKKELEDILKGGVYL